MAMQSGNVVLVPEKTHGGEAVWYPHQMDERDGFISWIRGEFAAANAMIDALCHHLGTVGEPGEYDGVIGCIQQRRCNWNPVLHMQQYFSVAEVVYALNQVGWRRHQRGFDRGGAKGGREYRRGGSGRFGGAKYGKDGTAKDLNANAAAYVSEHAGGDGNLGGEERVGDELEEKKVYTNSEVESSHDGPRSVQVATIVDPGSHAVDANGDSGSNSEGAGSVETESCLSNEKKICLVTPKTFVGTEVFDGRTVNVVDGMKLYEELFNGSEVSKLATLVKDLRVAGRNGKLQGQTFIATRRPMKGHGREMMQFGHPIADAPLDDESVVGSSKDRTIQPIPSLLQDVIEQLVGKEVVSVKPDSCIIDIFDEGEFSHPHMWSHSYGRPVCVLFVTECDMTFGKIIIADHPGDFHGALRLSLAPGSVLVMQGRSSDFARHAIPSVQRQRILVTLTKSQPKKITSNDNHRFSSSIAASAQNWVPPPSRSPNRTRLPMGQKHYDPVAATNVPPIPAVSPQLAPPNGIGPFFASAPMAPFSAPVTLPPASTGWSSPPPRPTPPRLPVPGTGVFHPPSDSGSSSSNQNLMLAATTESNHTETGGMINGTSAPDSNGSIDGNATVGGIGNGKDEHQVGNPKEAGKPAGAAA